MPKQKPRTLKLILTGPGRCATGFYSVFLSKAGLLCGHEKFFNPYGYDNALRRLVKHNLDLVADSAWPAAPFLDRPPLDAAFAVHLIRHPQQVIESWMRVPTESAPAYWDFAARWCPRMDELEHPIDRYAHRYVEWNRLIERKLAGREHVRFDVAQDPHILLMILMKKGLLEAMPPEDVLYGNREHNKHGQYEVRFHLGLIRDRQVREDLELIAADYGYQWPEQPVTITSPVVKSIITTLDNCDVLQRQIAVLDREPLDEVVVVNNGSQDSTRVWLDAQSDLTVVHRENHGAGPGRNAGLDAAGAFDYVLMLDGGILPAVHSVERMLDYLEPRPGVSGLGVEVPDLRTDIDQAWLMWPEPVYRTYRNLCLSHTAYGMFRADAWDGFRFREEGPFGKPGWGGDDNEMAYQWRAADMVIRVATCGCRLPYFKGRCVGGSVHAYRKRGGSWARLKRETGLAPWGEGSVFEQRCVWLQQQWPQFDLGEQRDEPWITIVIKAAPTVIETAKVVKLAHKVLYKQKLLRPRQGRLPRPYSIQLWLADAPDDVIRWAEQRCLRRHYGQVITVDDEIVRRTPQNEDTWTGDFRLSTGDDWREDLRPNAYYYGYAETVDDITRLIAAYNRRHPLSRRYLLKHRPKRKQIELKVK